MTCAACDRTFALPIVFWLPGSRPPGGWLATAQLEISASAPAALCGACRKLGCASHPPSALVRCENGTICHCCHVHASLVTMAAVMCWQSAVPVLGVHFGFSGPGPFRVRSPVARSIRQLCQRARA